MKRTKMICLSFTIVLVGSFAPQSPSQTPKPGGDLSTVISNAVNHQDSQVRGKAIYKLQYVRPVTSEIISALVKSLRDESVYVRGAAVHVIGAVVKDDVQRREVVPSLLSSLRDRTEEEHIRERIVTTVAKIAPRLGEVVRALVAVLRDETESEELRTRAADGVRRIGSSASGEAASLVELAKDEKSSKVRVALWGAVASLTLDNEQAVQALIAVAGSAGDLPGTLRSKAIGILGEVGAVEAMPTLVKALNDEHPQVEGFAIRALGQLGSEATVAVPTLLRLFEEIPPRGEGQFIRAVVLGVLAQIDPTSPKVLATIQDVAANDPDPGLRDHAGRVLERMKQN